MKKTAFEGVTPVLDVSDAPSTFSGFTFFLSRLGMKSSPASRAKQIIYLSLYSRQCDVASKIALTQ